MGMGSIPIEVFMVKRPAVGVVFSASPLKLPHEYKGMEWGVGQGTYLFRLGLYDKYILHLTHSTRSNTQTFMIIIKDKDKNYRAWSCSGGVYTMDDSIPILDVLDAVIEMATESFALDGTEYQDAVGEMTVKE